MQPEKHAQHGYIHDKDDYLKRLRRIEGQARGLQKMVEDEKYCIDILTQISAVTKALQSVALGLLDEHLSHCVARRHRRRRARGRGEDPRGVRGDRPARPVLSAARRAPSPPPPQPENEAPMSVTSTYSVTGMTCEHCVAAVTEEVGRLDGVQSVHVDLRARRRLAW